MLTILVSFSDQACLEVWAARQDRGPDLASYLVEAPFSSLQVHRQQEWVHRLEVQVSNLTRTGCHLSLPS